ncbi:MAG: Protein GrpE [Microgenomates bacterium OLB23]|nr:MAG: Protein GrpE [Microgenomates bacterium OLB23]
MLSEADEYKNKYLRALADYQNLEKRFFNEKKESEKHITRRVVERFLSVMDDIERAQAFHEDEGLTMIAKQFENALKDLGVSEIELVGKEFDPLYAEAIEMVEGDHDNLVMSVARKGYMMGDSILRPAQVRVSKKVSN